MTSRKNLNTIANVALLTCVIAEIISVSMNHNRVASTVAYISGAVMLVAVAGIIFSAIKNSRLKQKS